MGGAYRPFLHDRHFKAASSFQIGMSRGVAPDIRSPQGKAAFKPFCEL
jgi:hypothetical protein